MAMENGNGRGAGGGDVEEDATGECIDGIGAYICCPGIGCGGTPDGAA